MKILLTGYKGFIGRHLHHALQQHDVCTADLGDPLPNIAGLDWIVHVGANSSTVERDVEKIFQQNLDYSIDLYNQAVYHGVNFQFASSASIYGLGHDFAETAPPDPRTPYAWTKWLFERHVAYNPPSRSCVQLFRYFNVYGTGEEHKGGQASPYTQFARQAREQGYITVFENSDQYRRDFVPVETIVDYHLQFMNLDVSGVFNLGTGTTKSFQEIAESFGVPIRTVPMPEHLRASYQAHTCADMSKTWSFCKQRLVRG